MKKFISNIPRNHLIVFILVGGFLVFKKGMDINVIGETSGFVKKNSDFGIWTFPIILSLLIFSIIHFREKWKDGYRPYNSTYILSALILMLYLLGYRLNPQWEFPSVPYLHWIKYADLILAVVLIWLSIVVRNPKPIIIETENLSLNY